MVSVSAHVSQPGILEGSTGGSSTPPCLPPPSSSKDARERHFWKWLSVAVFISAPFENHFYISENFNFLYKEL